MWLLLRRSRWRCWSEVLGIGWVVVEQRSGLFLFLYCKHPKKRSAVHKCQRPGSEIGPEEVRSSVVLLARTLRPERELVEAHSRR